MKKISLFLLATAMSNAIGYNTANHTELAKTIDDVYDLAIKQYGENVYGYCMAYNAVAKIRHKNEFNCTYLPKEPSRSTTFTQPTDAQIKAAQKKAYDDAIKKYGDNRCGRCMADSDSNNVSCKMGGICSNAVVKCICPGLQSD